jgi:hypothetical protein
MPDPRSGALDSTPYGFTNGFDVSDILFDDRIGREWFYRVAFYTVSGSAFTQLEQLDSCRADIQTDERRFCPFK